MKTLSRIFQTIACLWLSVGMASPLHGGVIINSYVFSTAGGGGSDPYFANVVLLMHFDGADNSTTFTDSSSYARTISTFGNAKLVTAQKAFGTASGYFDGSGDYLTVPSSVDWNFGTGDFTVETWVRFNALPAASASLVGNYPGTWVLQYRPDQGNKIAWYNGSFVYSAAVTITTGVWYHFAVSRTGTSLRIFLDGVQTGSTITDSSNYSGTNELSIGRLGGIGQELNGWEEDLRISKGVGRYTTSFTPTGPHPDS